MALLIFFILIAGMFLFEFGFAYIFDGGEYLGLIIYFCVILLFLLIPIIRNISNKKKEKQDIASGNWQFPIETFYEKCKEDKLTEPANDTHIKKMMLIAKDIILKSKIPEEYLSLYYNEEKVKNYYKAAEEKIALDNKKTKELEEQKKVTPQVAELNSDEKRNVEFQKKIKNFAFAEKRKFYLESLIKDANIEKTNQENLQNLLVSVPINMRNSLEKEKNSIYTHAGLAQGVGGPIASSVVASKKITEYQQNKVKTEQEISDYEKMQDQHLCNQ